MDKMMENNGVNHIISINERKSIIISGVKKIESFDNEEFLLNTNLGILHLKGENLEMIKLDTLEGKVSIKGKINSLEYLETSEKIKENGLFNKLFK
jgi:sporulation protein YabP